MPSFAFQISKTFSATPDEVFKALTVSKTIKAWSSQAGKVQSTIGGKIEWFDGWVTGTILAFVPGKQLSFTWKPAEWAKEDQPSIVSCTFAAAKSGTKLTLKHSGFPSKSETTNHKSGWNEFVFEPLKLYLLQTKK